MKREQADFDEFAEDYRNILTRHVQKASVPHKEHKQLLAECQRVLKEAGRIYIFEHNLLNPVTEKIVKDCEFDRDAVFIMAGRLRRLLKQTGMKRIKVSYTIFFPRKGIWERLISLEKYLSWIPIGGQYYIRCEK